MKTTLALTLASAAAGALIAKLSNAAFLASVPFEIIFAGAVSVALIGITLADYARNVRPLTVKAPVARVVAPVALAPRSSAYGVRRRTAAIVERTAA